VCGGGDGDCRAGVRIAHMGHVNAPMILAPGVIEVGLNARISRTAKGGTEAAIEARRKWWGVKESGTARSMQPLPCGRGISAVAEIENAAFQRIRL